jgi:endonuclease/exonuclease/phosphatase family metal-dependent hydrolase
MEIATHPNENLETGSFAPEKQLPSVPRRLVIATYNIRYGVGSRLITGGLLRRVGLDVAKPRAEVVRRNLASAAAALSGNTNFPAPDIIALQEADKETRRAGGVHVALELARLLGWRYAHAPTRLPREHPQELKQWYLNFEELIYADDPGDTGLAFLSNRPFVATRLDLPWFGCPWRPRLAIGANWDWGAQKLQVYNAHIDPHATLAQQITQHETILAKAEKGGGPTVLLGDFNTLTPRARRETRRFLEAADYQTPFKNGAATWRAGPFTNHTDWIFTRRLRTTRWNVARDLRQVSDHWPLWAEIELMET